MDIVGMISSIVEEKKLASSVKFKPSSPLLAYHSKRVKANVNKQP
jgi:hypothetical protein